MAGDSYAVRLYEPDLADACDRFIRRVWPESVDERGRDVDGEAARDTPPRVLFLKGTEVIGHVATTPVQLAVCGRLRPASWAVGLMVVPEHRNGPVAPFVVKKLSEAVEIGLTLHVEQAALRVFTGVGWHHLGVIPQYMRVINARAFVNAFAHRGHEFLSGQRRVLWSLLSRTSGPAAILGSAFFAGLACAGAATRLRGVRSTVVEEYGFDPSYTELAERAKDSFAVWVFRDEAYLVARYGRCMGTYRLLACREHSRLLGYCIVKIRQFESDPRMCDLRMGTIVDCVFEPAAPGVLDSLVRSVIKLCRRERVDVILCTASLDEIGRHLRRHAFVRVPGTLNAAFYDRTHAMDANLPLESWHLMRGDSDADANC